MEKIQELGNFNALLNLIEKRKISQKELNNG
jgi:hypothetical protein